MPRKKEFKSGPHGSPGQRVTSVLDKKSGTIVEYLGADNYLIKDDDGLEWFGMPTLDWYYLRENE